ncbi:MAG: hypothetical protein A2504_00910 [Bdellovibrionales bacterium RIFOXYD12_FULL_39_22]|nr:MAG: hypothetical protein A2385_03530 [Bdellovibrionales bacterium RIFOXYB1_FULL_39_21]OFZ42601.1 MAG: hypothetical protein A2485_09775 [Bdellovibrionales bacterium RIFOXYC12_FULL_39_17]OFZ47131.1 MAG: hypothetical protein A2404_15520 [Bdellovibrionales bacterium RIFOXYC1_FULL_39_130]OFZ75379.1 MAG: hypothetical protein A2560_14295 [Bdellovibrionales bacterium RIFOXYD1_FULL_39_84]OFZ75511.1 MAG: hypothetical protein A2451_00525 [Bdellovibrionales bacterium RIFOXYC2_FULL_39_8]OFZ93330.1 MAG:
MSLYYETVGAKTLPLLVAVHGLMGGVEELKFLESLHNHFHVIFVDFNYELKKKSIADRDLKTIDYDHGSDMIANMLETKFGGKGAYFFGSSYGGKIIFDFMAKFPRLYLGGVFGDISPAPIEDTEFYKLTYNVVPQLNMNQDWKSLKKQIKELVPDRNAYSLLASQVYYPTVDGPAIWRTGVHKLNEVMSCLKINNQWHIFEKMNDIKDKKSIILVAENLSSISEGSLARLKSTPLFELISVPDASHFINITHHQVIIDKLLSMIQSR